MDPDDLESMIRRVIREELALAWRTSQAQPRKATPEPRRHRLTAEDEAQGAENMRMVDDYMRQIDPGGNLSREEALDALRFRFPHFGL